MKHIFDSELGNSFGNIFKLTTFGESHGPAIGGVIDGCPAGLTIDFDFIQLELNKRKPGQSAITTQRNETDSVEFLSGIFEKKTTGAPIGFIIRNNDQRSNDYEKLKNVFRPSHADFTYHQKYDVRDYRGGGRSSARETACRVVAGAIAQLLLKYNGISTYAFVKSVEKISTQIDPNTINESQIENNIVRCPDESVAQQMISAIENAREHGNSLGGIVTGVIKNVPAGLGEPVFQKFNAALGFAMLGINAVKGFEYGSGFEGTLLSGMEHNDEFVTENGKIVTKTNCSGGIQGGITNGNTIYFNVAFKATATILSNQTTVDKDGNQTEINPPGRHDPCVLPRAVPIVKAMAAIVTADFLLLNKTAKL